MLKFSFVQLYVGSHNSIYAINTIQPITESKTVPVAVYIGEEGEYKINVLEQNYQNTHVYLEDLQTTDYLYLNEGVNYTFESATGKFTDRFLLHFNPNNAPVVSNNIPDQQITVGDNYNYSVPTNVFVETDLFDEVILSAVLTNGEKLPTWLSFNPTTKVFSGRPVNPEVLEIQVTATDKLGANVSDIFLLTVSELLNIDEVTDNISVYPNPTTGEFTIYSSIDKIQNVEIVDITGKIITTQDFDNNNYNINITSCTAGVYTLKINTGNNVFYKKIILR